MSEPVVFVASDAAQCKHLLSSIGTALTAPRTVEYVARRACEGEYTSVYLFSFYEVGYREGRRRGMDVAFDHVYGRTVVDVAARTRARRARRAVAKRK